MSKARRATAAGSLALFAMVALPLRAQDEARLVDSLRREYLQAARAASAARGVVKSLQDSLAALRRSTLVAGGRTVRFSTDELTAADTAAIADGLRLAHARLIEWFGPAGARLIDEETWVASAARRDARVLRRWVSIALSTRDNASSFSVNRPIAPTSIERASLRVAADGIERLSPALKQFSSASISLADEPDRWEAAAREMALSWTSVGRRCVLGSLGACEAVMTPHALSEPAPSWIDETDAKAAVTTLRRWDGGFMSGALAGDGPGADSVVSADIRRCLKTDDPPACDRVMREVPQKVRIPDPFSGYLRGSLVIQALETGGTSALERLRNAPDSVPLALLAHVAGVSADSLLSSWQSRISSALEQNRVSPLPSAASTLAWCSLLFLVAIRRRR